MTGEHSGVRVLIMPGDITGVVLCGGEARRMGGVEKPLLPLGDKPLVGHVLERMAPQVGRIIISANRELDAYGALGHEVISDVEPGLGPLGGLASVALHVSTPWIFCCPGDAPYLDRTMVSRLAAAGDTSATALYPHDGQIAHYLFLLVRTEVCASLTGYLDSGARSVHGWLASTNARPIQMPDLASTFVNVNDEQTLESLRAEN